jgi:hypothetical protein
MISRDGLFGRVCVGHEHACWVRGGQGGGRVGAEPNGDDAGHELRERAGSGKQLDEFEIVDSYVRMIFATDEDDADAKEGEGEREGEGGLSVDEDGAGAGGGSSKAPKSAPAAGSWAGVNWAVAPTGACSVAGKMWKCDK